MYLVLVDAMDRSFMTLFVLPTPGSFNLVLYRHLEPNLLIQQLSLQRIEDQNNKEYKV